MDRKGFPLIYLVIGLCWSFLLLFHSASLSLDHQPLTETSSTPLSLSGPSKEKTQFDPDRIADVEFRMWKAYYDRKIQEMGFLVIELLLEQFRLPASEALVIAADLSSAALTFQSTREDYQKEVLPNLKSAYRRIKTGTKGTWDADAAARAELEWWVKRRTPGHNSPEEVGRSITKLYKVLYGKSNKAMERAGLLRARAAYIRDSSGDWPEIQRLLQESYRSLIKAITVP